MKNITKEKNFVNHIEISTNVYLYVFQFLSKTWQINVSSPLLQM